MVNTAADAPIADLHSLRGFSGLIRRWRSTIASSLPPPVADSFDEGRSAAIYLFPVNANSLITAGVSIFDVHACRCEVFG